MAMVSHNKKNPSSCNLEDNNDISLTGHHCYNFAGCCNGKPCPIN